VPQTIPSSLPNAVIYGCSGIALTEDEKHFFAGADPAGFILFQRNCRDADQVRALVDDLRGCTGRADAPVLIDQEGGRVQRLQPPHWRDAPAAAVFKTLAADDRNLAIEAARINAQLIAEDLTGLGITVNCAPVLDVPAPGAHGCGVDAPAAATHGASRLMVYPDQQDHRDRIIPRPNRLQRAFPLFSRLPGGIFAV